uniref:Large ribosomal subunit protein bL12c n=1 Tax=Cyanidium caldarium TaxID=2771 RepID=RK12_CYACA|nr:ribosomal protein L12 [Cyanidium caldarium]Q9TLZ9.1 RecName: Full=Large ribosomal subunit protein bL12c; AltName: Full=50S ribosomal protein L12, chloroplastic [Cyanidium caldarium]AAF12976.1 unknown [Cyanidium caldarium]WDB00243.1 ribosomal protein L12 [Cyanidium caldarium]
MDKIDEIVEKIKLLSLLEASELVKRIEDTFQVNVSNIQPVTGLSSNLTTTQQTPESAEVKEKWDVILENVPADKKIAILKVVRSITGLGLKEAKEFVESVPKIIKQSISQADAEHIKQQIEDAGASVVLK